MKLMNEFVLIVVGFVLFGSLAVSAECGLKDFVFTGLYKTYNVSSVQECYNTTINITTGSKVRVLDNASLYLENVVVNSSGYTSAATTSGISVRGGNFTAVNVTFKGHGSYLYSTINATDGALINFTGVVFYNPGFYNVEESGILCSSSTYNVYNLTVYSNAFDKGISGVNCTFNGDLIYINRSYFGGDFVNSSANISNVVFNDTASSLEFSGSGDVYLYNVSVVGSTYSVFIYNLDTVLIDNIDVYNTDDDNIDIDTVDEFYLYNANFTLVDGYNAITLFNITGAVLENITVFNISDYGIYADDVVYIDLNGFSAEYTDQALYYREVDNGNISLFSSLNTTGNSFYMYDTTLDKIDNFTILNSSSNCMLLIWCNITNISNGNITYCSKTGVRIENTDPIFEDIWVAAIDVGMEVYGYSEAYLYRVEVFLAEIGLKTDIRATIHDIHDSVITFTYGSEEYDLSDYVIDVDTSEVYGNTKAVFNPFGIGGEANTAGEHTGYYPNVDIPGTDETSIHLTTGPNSDGDSHAYTDFGGEYYVSMYKNTDTFAIFNYDLYYAIKKYDEKWYLIKHNIFTDDWEQVEISSQLNIVEDTEVQVFNFNDKVAVFSKQEGSTDKRDGLYQVDTFDAITLAHDTCLTCAASGSYPMRIHYTQHPEYDEDVASSGCGSGITWCIEEMDFAYNKDWTDVGFFNNLDTSYSIIPNTIIFDDNNGFWIGGYARWNSLTLGWRRDAFWFHFSVGDDDAVSLDRHIYAPMITTWDKRGYGLEVPLLYDDFVSSGVYASLNAMNARVHLATYSNDEVAGTLSYGQFTPKAGVVSGGVVMGDGYYDIDIDGTLINTVACDPYISDGVAAYSYYCGDIYTVNKYTKSAASGELELSTSGIFTNDGADVGTYSKLLKGSDGFVAKATGGIFAFGTTLGSAAVWNYEVSPTDVFLGGDSHQNWDGVILYSTSGDNLFTIISDDFDVCANNDWTCGADIGEGGLCNEYGDGIPGLVTGAECRALYDIGDACVADSNCMTRNCGIVSGLCEGVTKYCDLDPETDIESICVPARENGEACTRDAQCESANCINGTFLDYTGKIVGEEPAEFWGRNFNETSADDFYEGGVCAPVGYNCTSSIRSHLLRYHGSATQDLETYMWPDSERAICSFDTGIVTGSTWHQSMSTFPINSIGDLRWCNVPAGSEYGVCKSYFNEDLDYSITDCPEDGTATIEYTRPTSDIYKYAVYASNTDSAYEFVTDFGVIAGCTGDDDLDCSRDVDFTKADSLDTNADIYVKFVGINGDLDEFCPEQGCLTYDTIGDFVSEALEFDYNAVSDCWVVISSSTTTTTTTTTTIYGTTTTIPGGYEEVPQDGVCRQYCIEANHDTGRCYTEACTVGDFGCYSEFQNLCQGCGHGDYCLCIGGDPVDINSVDLDKSICSATDYGALVECSFKTYEDAEYNEFVLKYRDSVGNVGRINILPVVRDNNLTSEYYKYEFCMDDISDGGVLPLCDSWDNVGVTVSYDGFTDFGLITAFLDSDQNLITTGQTSTDVNYFYYDRCLTDDGCAKGKCDTTTGYCTGTLNYVSGYPRYQMVSGTPFTYHKWVTPYVCKKFRDDGSCETSYEDDEFSYTLSYVHAVSGDSAILFSAYEDDTSGILEYHHSLADYELADILTTNFTYKLSALYTPEDSDPVIIYAVSDDDRTYFNVTVEPCDDTDPFLTCDTGLTCSAITGLCGYAAAGGCELTTCTTDVDCSDCYESTNIGDSVTETFCSSGVCKPMLTNCVLEADCDDAAPYLSDDYWEGVGTPEFYCPIDDEKLTDIWYKYYNWGESGVTEVIDYAQCVYLLDDGLDCLYDADCISGICSNNGAYKCDGAGSVDGDNTCTGGELVCTYSSVDFTARDDNICVYDGIDVAGCLPDGLCYINGVCVDASTVLCNANVPDGADGDLLCQGASGLSDSDAYCSYDGICVVDDVDPGDPCRTDEWCGDGYSCTAGYCTLVGRCPLSTCAYNFEDPGTGELVYKGRGLLSDTATNCGCDEDEICVAESSEYSTTGVCATPLLNGVSCGTGNTVASWDHGDFLCNSMNCMGDSFPNIDGTFDGECVPADVKCRDNVDIEAGYFSEDPEYYCHCSEDAFDFDDDNDPCSTIVPGSYDITKENILNTVKYCYNEYMVQPPGAPTNEDYGCYDRKQDGMSCTSKFECLSGVCSSGLCIKGADEEVEDGGRCIISHASFSDSAVWNKFSNGETKDTAMWSDNCGVGSYCDPCVAGYLVSDPAVECNSLGVEIGYQSVGVCKKSTPLGGWCYSASQCVGFGDATYNSGTKTVACYDETGTGECSAFNEFCSDSNPASFNKFCTEVAAPPCVADELEPFNEFTVSADDPCYDNYLRLGINNFCDDRHMCYIDGKPDDVQKCEDLDSSDGVIIHDNEGSKCAPDYCPASTEPYLSPDCIRDPRFDEFHVNLPSYSSDRAVVYCDGDGANTESGEDGLCKWRKDVGSSCVYPVECMYGLECRSGKCSNERCVQDSDCAVDFKCISGLCQAVSNSGFIVTSANGFTKPLGSPFVKNYDFVIACDEEDYNFKVTASSDISVKYSIEGSAWQWFGPSDGNALPEMSGAIPGLCTDTILAGVESYDDKEVKFAQVIDGVVSESTAVTKVVLVLYQGLDIGSVRCQGDDLNDYCGTEEDRDKFVLLSDNTYVSGGNIVDDPRRFKCDSAMTANSIYDTPVYPRTELTQFGSYGYALIQNWSDQKYFRCVDEYGYVYTGSTLINPAEFLFEIEFTWEQQIILMLVFLLGIPTLVLAGTRKVVRTK